MSNRAQRRQQQRAKPGGKVMAAHVFAQDSVTPQWRRSIAMVYQRDSRTTQRISQESSHQASCMHVATARNNAVRELLASDCEWLWFTDTDASFDDDILERMLAVAEPETIPILGALAFGVRVTKDEEGKERFAPWGEFAVELFPTIYTANADGSVNLIYNYPHDQLIQCQSTGAHCLLIHRSVLADPRWLEDGHPLPWFRGTVAGDKEVSEDQFFCLKAGSLGYPVHVDTRIKTGHVKTFVAGEMLYRAQMAGSDGDS